MRARSAVRDLQHERSGRVADKAFLFRQTVSDSSVGLSNFDLVASWRLIFVTNYLVTSYFKQYQGKQ